MWWGIIAGGALAIFGDHRLGLDLGWVDWVVTATTGACFTAWVIGAWLKDADERRFVAEHGSEAAEERGRLETEYREYDRQHGAAMPDAEFKAWMLENEMNQQLGR